MIAHNLIQDLVDYTGFTEEQIRLEIAKGGEPLAHEWKAINPNTDAEILWFYRTTRNYFSDQVNWHYNYQWDQYISFAEKAQGKCLDYGAGIGTISLLLADSGLDASYFEINVLLRDFFRFRIQKYGLRVNILAGYRAKIYNLLSFLYLCRAPTVLERRAPTAGPSIWFLPAPVKAPITTAPTGAYYHSEVHRTGVHTPENAVAPTGRTKLDLRAFWGRRF